MNVLRTLPLLALVALLSACAGKPVRDAAPVSSTVVAPSASVDGRPSAHAEVVDVVEGPAPATAPSPPADNGLSASAGPAGEPTVDSTEDDFDALYGRAGAAPATAASYDPWEGFNRRVHAFNMAVDTAVARPLATAYTRAVPRFARTGVSNFFSNLRSPVTIANQLLQGRPDDAWDTLARFMMNSTLGVGGLWDPASKALVANRREDFGQTLGAWGWRRSRYVELPFFGPRTVRDVFGLAGDIPLSPIRTIEEDKFRIGLQGLQLVDTRAQLMALDDIRDSAVDEYALTRDAWLQRRNYQIENDLRGRRERGKDEQTAPIPVDAMPMPDWGN